jgi:putative NADH-flavin reductase
VEAIMQLFVLGATGRTGTQILDLALARGHEVTAFVRSPDKLARRERLTVVAGDPRDTAALATALPGHHAVLSALGPPAREALRRGSALLTECAAATVAAMTTAGVARLAIVSAGVLFPEPRGITFAFFRWLLRHHARDLATMEAIVDGSGLAWTIVRPPRLVEVADDAYRAERDALPAPVRTTSFRAVAAFMLDAVERRAHIAEIVGVSR